MSESGNVLLRKDPDLLNLQVTLFL